MFVKSAVAVALLASFTAAATTANSTIDPTTIDASERSAWCSSEINVCGTLCSGNVDDNTCDTTSLNYTCTCASNSSTPGLQYYTGTMPTFICEQIYQNCIVAGENDAAAQKACTTARDTNCGTLDPTNFTAAATTTSSSSSATATATSTGTASSTSASASATGNAAVGSYQAGAGVVAAGVAAAFGFLL